MSHLHGKFKINPRLQGTHLAYLDRFSRIRHMKRDVLLLEQLHDPVRKDVGLPLGSEGAYYLAGERFTEHEDPTVTAFNDSPCEQPGLWCHWEPTWNGESFIWRDGDKHYDHSTWIKYLIEHFFNPWDYKLSGKIECKNYFYEVVHPNGDENREQDIPYVEKSELVVTDNNIVIENNLGIFRNG